MEQTNSDKSILSNTWEKLAVGSGAIGIVSGLFLPIINIPLAGGVTLLDAADLAELLGESSVELYLALAGIVIGSLLLIGGGLKKYTLGVIGMVIQSGTVGIILYYLLSEGVFTAEIMGQTVASPGTGLYGLVGAAVIGIVAIIFGR